jgi:hypothetical protein
VLKKLQNIVDGWKGYLFHDAEAKKLAESRAVKCSQCEFCVYGIVPKFMDDEVKKIKGMVCDKCNCPLSTKLRAKEEVCPIGLW